MKTVNLAREKFDLEAVINLARTEPVLLLTPDGKEFCIAEADDFEREVNYLRESHAFQGFLDERSACAKRTSLVEIEKELELELSNQGPEENSV
jgi:PHD/YefM family antitoxin component YafN of YafNO toxin-antitoxin module